MALILPFRFEEPTSHTIKIGNGLIRIKAAKKIRKRVCYEDANPSEIIVNTIKLSESTFGSNEPFAFIKSKSIHNPRRFLLTTRTENTSNAYDVYEVPQPPQNINNTTGFTKLCDKAYTDMREEIPGSPNRGRYVSFEDLGILEQFSEEKIASLKRIVKSAPESEWPRLFEKAGITDLVAAVEFIDYFECTIIPETEIDESSIQDSIKVFSAINTRELRHLKKYYNTAITNTKAYTRMAYAYKLLTGRPLQLFQNETPKQLVKRTRKVEQDEGRKAA